MATAAARGAREGKAQAHVSGISRLEPTRARGTSTRTRRRRSRDRPGRGARRPDPSRPVPRRTDPAMAMTAPTFPRAATPSRASIPVVHGSNVLRSPERAEGGATRRRRTASDAAHRREGRGPEPSAAATAATTTTTRRVWTERSPASRPRVGRPGGASAPPTGPPDDRSLEKRWKTSGNSGRPSSGEGVNDAKAVQRAAHRAPVVASSRVPTTPPRSLRRPRRRRRRHRADRGSRNARHRADRLGRRRTADAGKDCPPGAGRVSRVSRDAPELRKGGHGDAQGRERRGGARVGGEPEGRGRRG